VSEQPDSKDFDQLEQINYELTASLRCCRAIVRDCQQKLAANSNDTDEDHGEQNAELA
jgi:hypothetical protein